MRNLRLLLRLSLGALLLSLPACDLLDDLSTTEDLDVLDDVGDIRDVTPDTTPGDTTQPDATTDTRPPTDVATDTTDAEEDTVPPPPPCPRDDRSSEQGPRTLLLGLNYEADGGEGRRLRTLTLQQDGTIADNGVTIDVGQRLTQIVFAANGLFAYGIGESYELLTIEARSAGSVEVIERTTLPGAGYRSLRLSPDGQRLHVVGFNSTTEGGGIHAFYIACDGTLQRDAEAYAPVVLASDLAFVDDDVAVVAGGQRTFDTPILEDVRLMRWTGFGWDELFAGDFFAESVRSGRIAVAPDRSLIALPNNGTFTAEGGAVLLLRREGDTLVEVQRLTGLEDVEDAWFSPDGQTLIVNEVEPGRIAVFRRQGASFVASTPVTGLGLPDYVTMVLRGNQQGRVLVPSVRPAGNSTITVLNVSAPGQVQVTSTFQLGNGVENIPGPIAVRP